MLQLLSKKLTETTSQHLDAEKQKIMSKTTFQAKVEATNDLWGKKKNGAGAIAFKEIREKLDSMCRAPGICCYCENNEGTDIEHVVPKRVFPEITFDWDNYLLACTKCNSTYKNAKASVFNPAGSANTQDVTPKKNIFIASPTDDSLFINPRTENPQ